MEFIDGDSLRDRMNRFPQGMNATETMQWFAPLAAGVAYLHDQGIVHRDLKPGNVFLDGGLVKIGDYGLSKYISASRPGGQTESVGTFHYMAPEIGRGEYGKEIDIYSLGILLHELLTGSVPFDGESSQEIILKHLTADPDLSQVPQPFAAVIRKALAKNPASRFKDCRDMLGALGWELDASGLGASVPKVRASMCHPFCNLSKLNQRSTTRRSLQPHRNTDTATPVMYQWNPNTANQSRVQFRRQSGQ